MCLRLDAEHLGQIGAQREHALAVRPHGELAVLPLRDRARGADRARGTGRAACRSPQRLHRRGGGGRSLLDHRLGGRPRARHHVLVQRVAARAAAPPSPASARSSSAPRAPGWPAPRARRRRRGSSRRARRRRRRAGVARRPRRRPASCAPGEGGRTTRPKTMPGRRMSCT